MATGWSGGVTIIATGEGRDDEMSERIAAHRRVRPPGWTTIEEPLDLDTAFATAAAGDLVIVDCLTLWTANVMERGADDHEVLARAEGAAETAAAWPAPVIAISNEVGSGIVPMNRLARNYRDLLGGVNSRWVARAAASYLTVAGRLVPLTDPAALVVPEQPRA
jgi:adenosyl cobinamide kinase/adenosyl cobinamide phosphate guanylyltransferase